MLKTNLLKSIGEEKLYVDDVFSTYLYDGNGSTRTITNGIDLSDNGGMVWIKSRSSSDNNYLYDTVRGVSQYLISNSTTQQADSAGSGVISFNDTGFDLGSNTGVNASTSIFTSWTFRNAPKFFTHTTISHTNGTPTNIDLSVLGEIGMVIAKITNTTGDWVVWHRNLTAGNNLRLNTTAAQSTTNAWLSVSGTTATLSSAAPTGTYVIYAWAHDADSDGMVQCGSHTGALATVNLGWEPQFILHKRTDTTTNWFLCDNLRGSIVGDLVGQHQLFANTTRAETSTGATTIKATATGFEHSGSGTSIYLAIRIPNKPPISGTEIFQPVTYTGTNTDNRLVNTGIKTDMAMFRMRSGFNVGYEGFVVGDRLRGQPFLKTGSVTYEQENNDSFDQQLISGTQYGTAFSSMTGAWVGNSSGASVVASNINTNPTANNHIAYAFQRRPGFFDIVCYTGTGVTRTVPHQLGVAPELMIIKHRGFVGNWMVYAAGVGATKYLLLNTSAAAATSTAPWNNTDPTSSVFTVGTDEATNGASNNYVAYLFTSLPGISKVGSYTGNGTTQTINCGFTTGARFVLIKRTDSTGDWLAADTARGILSGNDPLLRVNSTVAEATTLDWIDADSSGFVINQESTANANVNAATYIYLAIA